MFYSHSHGIPGPIGNPIPTHISTPNAIKRLSKINVIHISIYRTRYMSLLNVLRVNSWSMVLLFPVNSARASFEWFIRFISVSLQDNIAIIFSQRGSRLILNIYSDTIADIYHVSENFRIPSASKQHHKNSEISHISHAWQSTVDLAQYLVYFASNAENTHTHTHSYTVKG